MSMQAQGGAIKLGWVLILGARLPLNHRAMIALASVWLVSEKSSAWFVGGIKKAA